MYHFIGKERLTFLEDVFVESLLKLSVGIQIREQLSLVSVVNVLDLKRFQGRRQTSLVNVFRR